MGERLPVNIKRLDDLAENDRRRGMAERLLAIGRMAQAEVPPGWGDRNFDAELYDEETGLPREDR